METNSNYSYKKLYKKEEVNLELKEVTFRKFAYEWLENKRFEVKLSTLTTYFRVLSSQLLPEFGDKKLQEINTNNIKKFLYDKKINGKREGNGGLSEKTIKDLYVILKNIFHYAEEIYSIENPCKNIKIKTYKKEITVLSEEERNYYTKYLLDNSNHENIGILISMYMGLRLGEVCSLKWKNIDLYHNQLKVESTVYRIKTTGEKMKTKLVIDSPKSISSVRIVPIPDFLVKQLSVFAKHISYEDYVLTGNPYNCKEPSTMRKYFKRTLKECCIKEISYHSLRHGFATMCIQLGFDVKTLSEILGHSNVNITLNQYVHSSYIHKQQQMNKISNYFLTDMNL